MPFPYKKMTEEDFAAIREMTAPDRVWVGEAIAPEYYHDEMPDYGVFPPELYVEVLNKEEVYSLFKYEELEGEVSIIKINQENKGENAIDKSRTARRRK